MGLHVAVERVGRAAIVEVEGQAARGEGTALPRRVSLLAPLHRVALRDGQVAFEGQCLMRRTLLLLLLLLLLAMSSSGHGLRAIAAGS